MRKLALAVLMVSAVAGGVVGCGGSSPRKPSGKGGSGGTAGGTAGATGGSGGGGAGGGAAGEGGTGNAGGSTAGAAGSAAGAGGAAGDMGAGGMSGAGGAAGAGGTGGTGGTPPPPLSYCEMHPELNRALPYDIAQDFKVVHVLSNNGSAGYFKILATPDCSDNPTYPPFTTGSPDGGSDGGLDAGDEAGTDAGVDENAADAPADSADDTQTLQLDDPDAADGGVADAPIDAAVDAPADVPAATTDAGSDAVAVTDAGPPGPACYEFSYDPDGCAGGNCWAGVVFEVNDVQGPSADTRGVCIAPTAMAVEFMARSSKNGANVKFGSIGEGVNSTEFYKQVTTTWTRYTVSIPGTYQGGFYNTTAGDMQGVWNAFSVVFDPGDYVGGAYVEVKDIRWIATAN